MDRLGLTGGIGSGKSTVAQALVALGAVLVDTDAIARELTAPGGAALPALQAEFGAGIVASDGALDRNRMRALAFGEAGVRHRLEAVLHPLIGQVALARADAAAQQGAPVVVFDVPLMHPASAWRRQCRRVLVVDCDEATQVQRVVQRSGWPADQVRAVMAQQLPRALRRSMADAVIHNDGLTLEQLQQQVAALWQLWRHDAGPVEQSA